VFLFLNSSAQTTVRFLVPRLLEIPPCILSTHFTTILPKIPVPPHSRYAPLPFTLFQELLAPTSPLYLLPVTYVQLKRNAQSPLASDASDTSDDTEASEAALDPTLTSDPPSIRMPPRAPRGKTPKKAGNAARRPAQPMGANAGLAMGNLPQMAAAAAVSQDPLARPDDWPKNCYASLEHVLTANRRHMSDLEYLYLLGVQAGIGHGVMAFRQNVVGELIHTGKVLGLDVSFPKYPKEWISTPIETMQTSSEAFDTVAAMQAAHNFTKVRFNLEGNTDEFSDAHRHGVAYTADSNYSIGYLHNGVRKDDPIGDHHNRFQFYLDILHQRRDQKLAEAGDNRLIAGLDLYADGPISAANYGNPGAGAANNGNIASRKRTYSNAQADSFSDDQNERFEFGDGRGSGSAVPNMALDAGNPFGMNYAGAAEHLAGPATPNMLVDAGNPFAYNGGPNKNPPMPFTMNAAGPAVPAHRLVGPSGVNAPIAPGAPGSQTATPTAAVAKDTKPKRIHKKKHSAGESFASPARSKKANPKSAEPEDHQQ
jgi:hypothetical protein